LPGWGANPGPLDLIYFLIFHHFTAEPQRLPNFWTYLVYLGRHSLWSCNSYPGSNPTNLSYNAMAAINFNAMNSAIFEKNIPNLKTQQSITYNVLFKK
jgi:hypothetical protein